MIFLIYRPIYQFYTEFGFTSLPEYGTHKMKTTNTLNPAIGNDLLQRDKDCMMQRSINGNGRSTNQR